MWACVRIFLFLTERMNETDVNELVPCPPWSNKVSKMAQPNLDFMGK